MVIFSAFHIVDHKVRKMVALVLSAFLTALEGRATQREIRSFLLHSSSIPNSDPDFSTFKKIVANNLGF